MSIVYGSSSAQSRGGLGFNALPELIVLPEAEQQRMVRIGELSHQVMFKVNQLVAHAFASNDLELAWVRKLMLGSIPEEYRTLASSLMIATGNRNLVSFFRADVVGGGQIAEVQCPGSGWAYNRILEKHYGIKAEDSALLNAYKLWANGRRLSWWLQEPKFEGSVRALVEELRDIGLKVNFAASASEFDPESAEAVIRRPQLPDLIVDPKGRRLLERWAENRVDMDLLPTMVTETKYLMVFLHHPQFHHLFTDEERGLCPMTTLIQSRDQFVEERWGKVFTVEKVFERLHKDYILKYGGGKKGLRSGCHAVYHLGVGSMTVNDKQNLLSRALLDWEEGEGWVLQKFCPARWEIDHESFSKRKDRYFSIFRPHYFYDEGTKQVMLVRNNLTACSDWKVHTQSNAYVGITT